MRDVIDKFPSIAALAREVGVSYKCAAQWAARDSIPGKYDLLLIESAKKYGVELTLEQIALSRIRSQKEAA
jgi:hypothetical protein